MKERLLLFFVLWVAGSEALAACYGRVLNPVTDIPWDGVFPITVAGARLSKAGINSPTTDAAPVCACQKGPILKAGGESVVFRAHSYGRGCARALLFPKSRGYLDRFGPSGTGPRPQCFKGARDRSPTHGLLPSALVCKSLAFRARDDFRYRVP